jgi:CRP-like cAMP-binding protein
MVKKLVQVPIFRGLSEADAQALVEIVEETTAKKGDYLFHEADAGDALYVVLEGTVEITKKDRAGTAQQLAKLGDGSALGEMSLVSNNGPRSASALAASDVRLLKISSTRFAKLIREDSVPALRIVHNLAQVMSRRLLLMDEKLVDLLDRAKKREELQDFQRLLSEWSF